MCGGVKPVLPVIEQDLVVITRDVFGVLPYYCWQYVVLFRDFSVKDRIISSGFQEMARGHQKIQSQQKAQKRAEAAKKSQGCDQKGAAQKALHHKCTVCMLVPVTAESRWEVDERCGDSMLKVRSSSRSRHDSTAATLRNRTRKDVYLFDKD
ncbi:hypothetical protein Y032_0064g3529 [Ancylostoma ceylanicum]|uniref:Small EDRK-rich factor-like N-terminal domain-containing protein n=1 Tax=Ancylostoma ceylanicum TaxID=53326 RepID=A0A016U106_9BILA|nr:hypothetical protein Y032_0064g3529 [Ancylostoma ceylanicum]